MKRIAGLTIALSTIFSAGAAHAMGGPIYVDSTCDTQRPAEASPALKEWLKAQPRNGGCGSICADLERFVKDVAANNKNWRAKCGSRP